MIAWFGFFVAFGADLDPSHVAEVAKHAEQSIEEVQAQLALLEKDDTVLERLAKPWEAKPWHEYGALFLTPERIQQGKAFLAKHEETFVKAERTFGVPRTIILAILGVETLYGKRMGDDVIANSLFTLGFYHERRGSFFRKELGMYLRLAKREGWSIAERKGSYAGAMGMGQFMPSSYLEYAVDFDEDGQTDLFGSSADAIGSVARYLALKGWLKDEPILIDATLRSNAAARVRKGLRLDTTVGALLRSGVTLAEPADPSARAKLFAFEILDGVEHRVGLKNFWVITRYNLSQLYARAVADLAASY